MSVASSPGDGQPRIIRPIGSITGEYLWVASRESDLDDDFSMLGLRDGRGLDLDIELFVNLLISVH